MKKFLFVCCVSLLAWPAFAGKLCLWKFSSAHAVVYLLGSVHALAPAHYPLPAAMNRAFQESDTLIVEVNTVKTSGHETAMMMRKHGFYPASETIEEHLSADTLRILKAYLHKHDRSLDEYHRMKPWMLGLTLGVEVLRGAGLDPALGIDRHFMQRAVGRKTILELETLQQQIDLLAGDPPEIQDLALRASVLELYGAEAHLEDLITAWSQGDIESMLLASRQSMATYPPLMQQFERALDERNRSMVDTIKEFIARGGTFLAIVGALHMGGDNGIINLLGKEYNIVQLSDDGESRNLK